MQYFQKLTNIKKSKWDKGEWWRGWTKLWYTIRNSVNTKMYPEYNNKKNENGDQFSKKNLVK
jgi:hypothetical protein